MMDSVEMTKENLSNFDLTILCTDHDDYDYDFIYLNSKVLIDTRGRYSLSSKIIRA